MNADCTESRYYRYRFSISLITERSELLLLFSLQNESQVKEVLREL